MSLNLPSQDLICILGPTASGKTSLAVNLAYKFDGEIISADSRQVYKGMDIGTGKDLDEFAKKDKHIAYHLIDVKEAGEAFNLYDFKMACLKSLEDIESRGKKPIICGGTGMYLDAVLFDYDLQEVPKNELLRLKLEKLSDEKLIEKLASYRALHNTTDSTDRSRLIRAIEIAVKEENKVPDKLPHAYPFIFGLRGDRSRLKERIENRLKERLELGMIEEVQKLVEAGLKKEDLLYYGLEYKFVGQYLFNDLNYNDMYQKLRSGIFNFSKRQMTWFRRMEKKGLSINWLNFEDGTEENTSLILEKLNG